MEGDGPVNGQPVKMGIAVVSFDPISADALTAYLMGVNPPIIGYLNYLGIKDNFWEKIKILGEEPEKVKLKFKLHSLIKEQLSFWVGDGI